MAMTFTIQYRGERTDAQATAERAETQRERDERLAAYGAARAAWLMGEGPKPEWRP